MLRWNDDARTLDLSVHDLLDDAAERGGLVMSAGARMRHGSRIHREIAEREGYESEVTIRHREVVREWVCTVHGRVDGMEEEAGRVIIEEVKSTALACDALERAPNFPRWERQLAMYVWFAAAAKMNEPVGRLRIVSLVDSSQRLIHLSPDPAVGEWLVAELERRVRVRDAWLLWRALRRAGPVVFAHTVVRPGQAEIAAAAEEAVRGGRHLLTTAPTGVGKTAAMLLGTLRGAYALDVRVFWATSRTTQQPLVERTLRAMADGGTPLRSVTMRAREKACSRCAAGTCDGANTRGFHNPDVISAIGVASAEAIATIAEQQATCAYALALDAAALADVVIGDYNYAFDRDVYLRRLFSEGDWVVVVDEAHQLPDRAMGWGSPGLSVASCSDAAARLTAAGEDRSAFLDLIAAVSEAIGEAGESAASPVVEPSLRRWRDLRDRIDEIAVDHALLPPVDDDPWPAFARDVFRFVGALERAGEETVCIAEPGVLRLLCRDPAPILAPRLADLRAALCMSATLRPNGWFRARCGMPDADEITIPSPFPPENRRVLLVRGVSTAFRHRDRDRSKLAAILDATADVVPGNIAIFFGSFDVMAELLAVTNLSGRERLLQTRSMGEDARLELLARMHSQGRKALCAVLGGIFAEGVDLPGDALSAALIVGPALPPPSVDRALLRQWMEERHDDGFALAFIHPGMTSVVQAAGRVVRSAEDRGVVALICQRFLRHEFREYLPDEWNPLPTSHPAEEARRFFAGVPGKRE